MSAEGAGTAAGAAEPLRIGVLGAASISPASIVGPAAETGARLVAIAARDRDRAARFAAEHGVERVLDSYRELVEDPEVEVVYNPLANGLHARWNLAAIAAGKHVLSEKPFAANAAEAAAVHAAGQRAGVVVADGFHNRYHPVLRRLLELRGGDELGELREVEAVLVRPAPAPQDPRWNPSLAGGALMDVGCYCLHAVRLLQPAGAGQPRLRSARATERAGLPGVDEAMELELELAYRVPVTVRFGMGGSERESALSLRCEHGEATAHGFVLPHLDDRVSIRTAAGSRVEHLGTRPSYSYQLEAFADRVRAGVPMPTESDDAVATMELIDACYRAAGMEPREAYRGG